MNDLLQSMQTFHFGQPLCLALLLLIPLWLRRSRRGAAPAITYSSLDLLRASGRHNRSRRGFWFELLTALAAVSIVMALAQPRVEKSRQNEKGSGIDIILVVDASRSMDSQDFDYRGEKISRRAALLNVMGEFIKDRTRDRIGVVGFAEKPFLVSPLTLDHSWMLEAAAQMPSSLGTAIGSGVEAAVDLLRKVEGANKVAIVVTDGLNTSGVDPLVGARTAQRFGIRLYTIGVVSYEGMRTEKADSLVLSRMARMTGGQFFQAANGSSLRAIYRQIDQFERREFEQARLRIYRELFVWCAGAALALLLLQVLFAQGSRMRLP